MILSCEKCQTRYLVTASALSPDGRVVRCSHCGHEWFQEPEDGDAGAIDTALDDDDLLSLDDSLLDEDGAEGGDPFDDAPEETAEPNESVSREFSLDEMMAEDEISENADDIMGEESEESEEGDDLGEGDDRPDQAAEAEEGQTSDGPEQEERAGGHDDETAIGDMPSDEALETDNERDESLDSIPESIKPTRHDSAPDDVEDDEKSAQRRLIGTIVVGAMFLIVVLLLLLTLKGVLVRAWPPSMAFYTLIGMDTPPPGEGLLFERINAVFEHDVYGNAIVDISGKIVNLTDDDRAFELLKADLQDSEAQVLDSRTLSVDDHVVQAHVHLLFHTRLFGIPEGTRAVRVYFAHEDKKEHGEEGTHGDDYDAGDDEHDGPGHEDGAGHGAAEQAAEQDAHNAHDAPDTHAAPAHH